MKLGPFIDYFIHSKYFGDRIELRKARLFVRACLLTSIFSISYVLLSFLFEYEKGIYLTGFNVVGFFILTFMVRTRIPLIVLGNLYVSVGAVCVITLSYFSGGLWSAIYPWIIAIPVLALLVVNRRAGIAWGVISLGAMTWMGMLALYDIKLPVEYNTDLRTLWFVTIQPGLLLIILVVSLVFEFTQTKALNDVEEKNKQLLKQQDIISEQASKLEKLIEEKDNIIRLLAHDLKNPLSNITIVTHLMKQEHTEEEEKKYLKMIDNSANNASNLVNRVLEMNALDQGYLEPRLEEFDLIESLSSVMGTLQESATRKNIRLELKNHVASLSVNSDRTYLHQIFENLISNALKFSDPGKKVVIETAQKGKLVVVRVIDEGPGISRADQKKIFKKFSRLSNKPTGGEISTGLGLSLVKQYAEQIGANVYYEPREEKGSVFVVEL